MSEPFANQLWTIPKSLDSKDPFPEITFVIDYIKSEQVLAKQIDDTYSALEKCYKTFSQTFESTAPKTTAISAVSPEANEFRSFIYGKKNESDHFESFAKSFGKIRIGQSSVVREELNTKGQQYINELIQIRSQLSRSLENLQNSLRTYDRDFQKVAQKGPQAIQAIANLNKKNNVIQSYYIAFHKSFVDYCSQRERIFTDIEAFLTDISQKYTRIIKEGMETDAPFFAKNLFEASEWKGYNIPKFHLTETVTTYDMFNLHPNCEDRYIEGENAYVIATRDWSHDEYTVSKDEMFLLCDSRGAFWRVKNKKNQEFCVPCEILEPK